MPTTSFEIRVCETCGLRYPLVEGHPFGTRCPSCLGMTRAVLNRPLVAEPGTSPRSLTEQGLERREKWAVLLDNIRSAWNVGSILRSADGFGFAHAYLCGITPPGDHEAVQKTALGAEDSVPWSYHRDAVRLVKGLKSRDWKIFALEEDRRAVEIQQLPATLPVGQPRVLILGNELTGVDPELLELCDAVLEIPMRGDKKSFNVAIAFGIASYALTAEERLD